MAERGIAASGKAGGKSRKPGMGRGLSAILSETQSATEATGELVEVPIGQVKPNPNQPRKRFEPEALAALSESVASTGIIQPLLVRPLPGGDYELVAGERRLRAAQQAGLERVPVIVRDSAEEERLQHALIENMVREDLNPVEEARACEALVKDLGLSKQEVAKRIGRSRPALSNLIRLLELPDEVLEAMEEGELSEGHGRAILAVDGHEERRSLGRQATRNGWSVRRTEEAARRHDVAGAEPAKRPRAEISDEEKAALSEIADRLESVVRHEVKVRPRGDALRLEIECEDFAELEQLVERLGA